MPKQSLRGIQIHRQLCAYDYPLQTVPLGVKASGEVPPKHSMRCGLHRYFYDFSQFIRNAELGHVLRGVQCTFGTYFLRGKTVLKGNKCANGLSRLVGARLTVQELRRSR